jgi:hypothetical protein
VDSHPVRLTGEPAGEPATGPAETPTGGPELSVGAVVTGPGDRLLGDQLDTAIGLGLGHVRLTVPWSAAQPRAGVLAGKVVEEVLGAVRTLRTAGVRVWLCLLSPDVPLWFDDEGGFTDDRTAGHWWPRWVETAADAFGDDVDGWVPFEAPWAMVQRLAPADARKQGEVFHTLTIAWRDAWRLLHGPVPVATSLDVRTVRIPADDVVAAEWARREDQLRWRLWLRGLSDGIVSIPGRADREVPDLAGAFDQLGIALSGTGPGDLEALLHRVAEQGPEAPLAATFRPTGPDRDARAEAVHDTLAFMRRLAAGLPLTRITFADLDATAHALG